MHRHVLLSALVLVIFVSSLLAQTIPQIPLNSLTVFGPRKFIRSTGTPVTETATFSIPSSAVGPYTLTVVNGEANGDWRVTSGVVKFNGQTIFTHNDFKKKVAVLEKTVTLTTTNTLEVTLEGKPGTYIIIAVPRTIHTPPQITIINPTNNFLTQENNILVQGIATDSSGGPVTVTLNNQPVPVSNDGSFSGVVPLQEGIDTVSALATNIGGLTSIAVRIGRRDSQPPILTINSPENNTTINKLTATVSGTVFDSTIVTLTLNGTTTAVGSDGSFTAEVALIEGLNVINVNAVDQAGNTTDKKLLVIRDTQPPQLTITTPLNGLVTKDTVVTVKGTVFDSQPQVDPPLAETKITLKINDQIIEVAPDNSFQKTFSLVEGVNTITVVARDSAGNTTTDIRSIRRDTAPPILTIISPIDSLLTKDSLVTVKGTVFDSTAVVVKVNDDAVSVAIDGSFEKQTSLKEGSNIITISATDSVGNTVTKYVQIKKDATPPEITLLSPVDGMITEQTSIDVVGKIVDSTTCIVTVNGISSLLTEGNSFNATVALHIGLNTISVFVTDAAGNSATKLVVIKCFRTFPPGTLPSAIDLQNMFTMVTLGDIDLISVLNTVRSKGDTVLPVLQELLTTSPIQSGDSVEIKYQQMGWCFSALALERIGSPQAYSIIQTIALSHSYNEVRGIAVNSLAYSYYLKCNSENSTPNNTILHTLILSIDDTTYLSQQQCTVGSIARDGLRQWTGIDCGDDPRTAPGNSESDFMSPEELKAAREEWWQTVGSKLTWNAIVGLFE